MRIAESARRRIIREESRILAEGDDQYQRRELAHAIEQASRMSDELSARPGDVYARATERLLEARELLSGDLHEGLSFSTSNIIPNATAGAQTAAAIAAWLVRGSTLPEGANSIWIRLPNATRTALLGLAAAVKQLPVSIQAHAIQGLNSAIDQATKQVQAITPAPTAPAPALSESRDPINYRFRNHGAHHTQRRASNPPPPEDFGHPAGLGKFMELRHDPTAAADAVLRLLDNSGYASDLCKDAKRGDHVADMELNKLIMDVLNMNEDEFDSFDPRNKFTDAVFNIMCKRVWTHRG
jgi:hypothetical protein